MIQCHAHVPRTRLSVQRVRREVKHAINLCADFERSIECKLAWDRVEELTNELDRQKEESMLYQSEHPVNTSSPKQSECESN